MLLARDRGQALHLRTCEGALRYLLLPRVLPTCTMSDLEVKIRIHATVGVAAAHLRRPDALVGLCLSPH